MAQVHASASESQRLWACQCPAKQARIHHHCHCLLALALAGPGAVAHLLFQFIGMVMCGNAKQNGTEDVPVPFCQPMHFLADAVGVRIKCVCFRLWMQLDAFRIKQPVCPFLVSGDDVRVEERQELAVMRALQQREWRRHACPREELRLRTFRLQQLPLARTQHTGTRAHADHLI